jgi:hypothetical protein
LNFVPFWFFEFWKKWTQKCNHRRNSGDRGEETNKRSSLGKQKDGQTEKRQSSRWKMESETEAKNTIIVLELKVKRLFQFFSAWKKTFFFRNERKKYFS